MYIGSSNMSMLNGLYTRVLVDSRFENMYKYRRWFITLLKFVGVQLHLSTYRECTYASTLYQCSK